MDFSYPLESSDGFKYIIELTEQSTEVLSSEDLGKTIYNITLTLIQKGKGDTNPILFRMGSILIEFLQKNDVILYFFCSQDDSDIVISKKKNISPQEFRSLLFIRIFKRINKLYNNDYFIMTYPVDLENGDSLYNHFISHNKNKPYLDELENQFHSYK